MDSLPKTVRLEVHRRRRARHMRLRVGQQNQIVVSVPWHCSDREIRKFVEAQRGWWEAQLAKAPEPVTLREWLKANPLITASGDQYGVRMEHSDRLRSEYVFENNGSGIVFRLPRSAASPDAALQQLVRRFAKDALTCRLAYHAKRLDLDFGRLSVRDQASRWGSCSANGDISLNWRLIIIEPVLQDYVLLHELAHLTEMNHSKRYWTLLDVYDPDRRAHEAALDALTPTIMRVGR